MKTLKLTQRQINFILQALQYESEGEELEPGEYGYSTCYSEIVEQLRRK